MKKHQDFPSWTYCHIAPPEIYYDAFYVWFGMVFCEGLKSTWINLIYIYQVLKRTYTKLSKEPLSFKKKTTNQYNSTWVKCIFCWCLSTFFFLLFLLFFVLLFMLLLSTQILGAATQAAGPPNGTKWGCFVLLHFWGRSEGFFRWSVVENGKKKRNQLLILVSY